MKRKEVVLSPTPRDLAKLKDYIDSEINESYENLNKTQRTFCGILKTSGSHSVSHYNVLQEIWRDK